MKIAVISGKGGSGKSSISAAFIALNERVVAVDCDVDASNLPLLYPHEQRGEEPYASGDDILVDTEACVGCGRCVDKCAFHALEMNEEGKVQTVDYQCEGCGLCVRLCPQHALSMVKKKNSVIYTSAFARGVLVHGRLCPGDDNSGKMIARMREIADGEMAQEQIRLQILDGPPGIGCPVISTVTGMDRVVIVTEPTLSGIADLQRAYKVAASFCHRVSIVINKADINRENCRKIADFCRQEHLPVVAELPFDRRWVEAQVRGESMVTYAPESKCVADLSTAFERIVGQV